MNIMLFPLSLPFFFLCLLHFFVHFLFHCFVKFKSVGEKRGHLRFTGHQAVLMKRQCPPCTDHVVTLKAVQSVLKSTPAHYQCARRNSVFSMAGLW